MKRWTALIAALVLCIGCSGICTAETPVDFPAENPAVRLILGAVENEIDALSESASGKSTLYFPYEGEAFASLEQFREYQREQVLPLLASLFNCNLAGRDLVTVRASFGTLTTGGKISKYYLVVTLETYTDPALIKEMEHILALVQGDTDREKVEWLQKYLYTHITYDQGTADCSGSVLALLEGRGVCMGYSRAFSELCRRMGIPCISLINDTHMWSSVYVDGEWLMLDVTQNIEMCSVISTKGHDYDGSIYSQAKGYMKNRIAYKGKAKALEMTDLTEGWYRKEAEYMLGLGVFKGTSDTTFSPDTEVTRGMFVTVLGRLTGAQGAAHSFSDVKKGSYYSGYVGWAQQTGIVQGMGDGTFAPEESITREQMCKMMAAFCRYLEIPLPEADQPLFKDHGDISSWARTAVYQMKEAGLILGTGGGKFCPQEGTTRAQTAVVVYRFSQLFYDFLTIC